MTFSKISDLSIMMGENRTEPRVKTKLAKDSYNRRYPTSLGIQRRGFEGTQKRQRTVSPSVPAKPRYPV